MTFPEVTIRLEIDKPYPTCPVAGCNELATDLLPQRMQVHNLLFCEGHRDGLALMISKQDYEDFVDALRQQGITKEPRLADGTRAMGVLPCCVPGCKAPVVTGYDFDPHKRPGRAATCKDHQFAVHHVTRKLNGRRLVNQISCKRTAPKKKDPQAEKRKAVILELYRRFQNERHYVEKICGELQQKKVRLLAHWVTDWNGRYKIGLQNWDWFVAYNSGHEDIRSKIQHYISGICHPRARSRSSRK